MAYFQKNACYAAGAGAWACLLSVFSSPAEAQTIGEALSLAYQSNLQLKADRAALRAEDQLRSEARAARRPQIFVAGSVTQNPSNFDNTIGGKAGSTGGHAGHVHRLASSVPSKAAGSETGKPAPFPPDLDTLDLLTVRDTDLVTKNVGVSVVQPIFNGFKIRNSIKEADAHVSAGRARLMSSEQELFAKTISAYLSVNALRETVALLQKNVLLLEQLQTRAEGMLGRNLATSTDTAQANARLALARARLTQAQARLVASEVAFSGAVGQKPATLESRVAVPEIPASLEEAIAIALRRNPSIVETLSELEAAGYSVRIAKGKLRPKVDAVANYGQTFDSLLEGNDIENSNVSLQLSMPLYLGGKEYATVRRAKYSERAWGFRLAEAKEDAENAVRIAWQNYAAAQASLSAAQLAARENELALQGVREENQSGLRSILDVLNAESEKLNADLEVIDIRQKRLLAAFELRKQTGTLTAAELGLDVALYDAEGLSNRDARKWFGNGIDSDQR